MSEPALAIQMKDFIGGLIREVRNIIRDLEGIESVLEEKVINLKPIFDLAKNALEKLRETGQITDAEIKNIKEELELLEEQLEDFERNCKTYV